MYEGSIEAQKRSFQVEFENIRRKVEKLEAEVLAIKKAPSGNPTSKKSAAVVATPSSSNNQRRQVEDRDQESQPVETHEINASTQNQQKQSQPSTLRKSYVQVVKGSPI